MSQKSVTGECNSCESSYNVSYIEQLASQTYPEYCPFCGELIEELSEDYIEDDDFGEEDEEEWD